MNKLSTIVALTVMLAMPAHAADLLGTGAPAGLNSPVANSSTESEMKNTTAQTLKLEGFVDCSNVIAEDGAFLATTKETVVSSPAPHTVNLQEGSFFASVKTPMTVTTSSGEVRLDKDAIALICMTNSDLVVVNLSTHQQKVRLVVENKFINPEIGMQVLVSKTRPSFRQVFHNTKVGQNDISSIKLNQNYWMTASNVSVEELLLNEPVIVAIAHDDTCKTGQKILGRIAKMAACMNVVCSDRKFSHLKSAETNLKHS